MPFFSPSSAFLLLPFHLLLVFGVLFVVLSQCCGGSKKEKPKKPEQSSSKTQPPSKTQASMASKSTTAKAEWANALPSDVASSAASMDYGTLQTFDTQFFGGAAPLKIERGTGKKGPAPPVAVKPPSKPKPSEKGKKMPSSHPDYGTLHLVDKDLFTKEQQAKDAKRTQPLAGPQFVSTGDKNYATLGQLDHNIFLKNPPGKPQQKAEGVKIVSTSGQKYGTPGQLDLSIFGKNAPGKPQQTAEGAKIVSTSDQKYGTLGQLDLSIFGKK